MKLLLVDDEPGIREGLAAFLRRKGHEVVTAGDCARAGELLEAGDLDLILTDWHLPDGVAEGYLRASECPAIAMSGHPEEIVGHPALREVLTKPVPLGRLVEIIASFESSVAKTSDSELPSDVAALVAAAAAVLDDPVTLEDDGTFVVLRAPLPSGSARSAPVLPELRRLGGDLRVLTPGGQATVEQRWFRDGRPDAGVPVVAPGGRWPDATDIAIDFAERGDGIDLSVAEFGACIDRAAEWRRRGRSVHFLNVPNSLLSWASGQGKTDDMPMRAPVGPRIPAVLADLWS